MKERSSTFSFSHLQHLIVLMVGDVFFILYLLNPTLSPQYSSVCSCLTVDIFLRRTCLALSVLFLISAFSWLPSSLSLEMNRISWFLRNSKIIFSIFTFYVVSEMSTVLALLERWWGTWELLSSKNCFRQLHFFFSAAIGCHVIRSVVSRLWLKCCKLSGPLAKFFFLLGP
jgi:hypothetical protein